MNSPHVAIYCTPLEELKKKHRVIVVINDEEQELGVFAYRLIFAANQHEDEDKDEEKHENEGGINAGSVAGFVASVVERCGAAGEEEVPGIVVLNPGELLYSHGQNRTVTRRAWWALPRPSMLHPATRVDERYNTIEGHRDPKEHITSVFDAIVTNRDIIAPGTEIYIVGNDGGAVALLELAIEGSKSIPPFILSFIHPSING